MINSKLLIQLALLAPHLLILRSSVVLPEGIEYATCRSEALEKKDMRAKGR